MPSTGNTRFAYWQTETAGSPLFAKDEDAIAYVLVNHGGIHVDRLSTTTIAVRRGDKRSIFIYKKAIVIHGVPDITYDAPERLAEQVKNVGEV